LSNKELKKIKLLTPLPYEPPEEEADATSESEAEGANGEENIPTKELDETNTSKIVEEKPPKEEEQPDNKREDDEIQLELF